jgi:ABC-type branched-subunit amino acid transport system substrate-binding protein
MPESEKYDVFISYSAKDRPWASEFVNALKEEGIRAWFDEEVSPGDKWLDKIEQALRESRAVVFLLTPESLSSPSASFEIGAALGANKKIIPINRGNVESRLLPAAWRRFASLNESSPRVAGKRVAEVIEKMPH